MGNHQNNQIYYGVRDSFYYVEICDKQTNRDNQISLLLEQEVKIKYHSIMSGTEDIYLAKFWKDKKSAIDFANRNSNFRLKEMNAEDFIQSIPDINSNDPRYQTNLFLRKRISKYLKEWSEFRKKYKCTSVYKKVTNPQYWLNCDQCGLIPLVWEYDNGRSTACGCGENEYNHHSIQSESIMSFIKRNNGSAFGYLQDELRMNWNQWVANKQDIYKEQKLKNPEIW